MSEISLQVSPFASSFFRQTAVIHILAFSNEECFRWWASSPAAAIINTADQIPALRLYKATRDHRHRELKPDVFVVCAIIGIQVVGWASWGLPKKRWRSETLMEAVYRKVIEYRDAFEDWMFPSWWNNPDRRTIFLAARQHCMEKFLGPGGIDKVWCLKVLSVHPDFQRRGVGTALLDWGLSHARSQGEEVYLEASEFGKGLYLKKGFKEVGELIVDDKGDQAMWTCMLWDPTIASSLDRIE